MEAKDDELQTNFCATRCSIWGMELVRTGPRWAPLGTPGHPWAPLGTPGHIYSNFATCSWELLTMLNPHFVAGDTGLFGGHKSEFSLIFSVVK